MTANKNDIKKQGGFEVDLTSTHNTREGIEKLQEGIIQFVEDLCIGEKNKVNGRQNITKALDLLLHQELQKAHQTWLREEIVKLEKLQFAKSNDPYSNEYEHGFDRAIFDIIDRYQSELDHPTETRPEGVHTTNYCNGEPCTCPGPTNITSE